MSAPCPTRSHSIKCVFSGSTQESASFVPRDRFFSVRMEESPQIITLNHILIAADFPAQLRIFTLQFCRTELSVDRLIIRNFLFQTVNLSLELCNQFVCRIHRLLQFGFLFLCCSDRVQDEIHQHGKRAAVHPCNLQGL